MFRYSPLPGPGSIRLLRLIAHPEENSCIECQLFVYPLQTLGDGAHLYEALSYVWGDQKNLQSISVNQHDLPIRRNLHAALLCLRDRILDRFIWVDAICINQEDKLEKGRQVQYTAEIYSRASRVIVWLGSVENDSDHAIEAIRLAAEEMSTKSLVEEPTKQAVLSLVRRSWFRRIWVLQEVGAARNVLLKCGRKEIGGYAFCAALNLRLFDRLYDDSPNLRSLIRSVIYLIRGAVFRPKVLMKSSSTFSLRIRPLGELIEMYHTREASRRHDKIFALLGMSSDDSIAAELLPDYELPWEKLLERLVRFLLCEQISVKTWASTEIAVINSQGCILGRVSSEDSSDRNDIQQVYITSKYGSEYLGSQKSWTLQASAKPVQVGDLICLLRGATKPMIIRLCRDYFAVIMISVTPPGIESGNIGYFELPIAYFRSEFLLVWDWEELQGNLEAQNYETMVGKRVAERPNARIRGHLDKMIRLWNVGLVLEDAGEYKKSEDRLHEALEGYERACGKENLSTINCMERLAVVCWKMKQWAEAETWFKEVIETRENVQGINHQDTKNSIANLTSMYRDQDSKVPRVRPPADTLNIPGMTRSKSPPTAKSPTPEQN
ncbi:heterokaryon incompatibility protein-domain-containing protein [Leptodontidium sp. 2 PMI_412]|nr:heterokaryon incompatibility protein-domain-containing protein [Leptodontidium sp. 2 PMI_412]